MASYKCVTITIVAICLCSIHLSSSQDTVVNGKQECPETIHNTTVDLRRVLKGGGGAGGGHASSGGAHGSSSGHGYSGESSGNSGSSTIPAGALAAGAAARSHGNGNHHVKNNGLSPRMGSDSLPVAFLASFIYSFAILSLLSWV